MSVTASNLLAGTNGYATPPQDVGISMEESIHEGVLSGFQVEAQASPNATVKVNAGVAIVRATPSSESERLFRIRLSANYNATIAANSSGSTKYDLVYIKLPAASLHTPPADGDLTEAATILTERHNASGEALTDTNGLVLAEVTVANGFSSIANSVINNKPLYANDGWKKLPFALTYASSTTATAAGDWSKYLYPGMKLKITQSGVDKYFFVMRVTVSGIVTTITLYGGTDYTFANAAVTNPYFSTDKSPGGFPMSPNKWYQTLISDTSDRNQSSPGAGTWYNPGSLTGTIPVGTWRITASMAASATNSGGSQGIVYSSVSTSNNSESWGNMTAVSYVAALSAEHIMGRFSEDVVDITSPTAIYVIAKSNAAITSIGIRGQFQTTIVRILPIWL